ncbi:LysM peptidoglycan-binding domain-containing protein [Carnobacterium viridans]|uniref:3D (Asp-Asp-Asp) domain-containing protein n=1 Tax=Carnobacterium viridans TaxID=174587 RepID=A0A1H0YP42_9LACT|nr:3D domain-containing protein [Carnobacterium viridans]UDE95037.1 LysM peptidoglycan-binding domain-containing protein [Carnobacterium viridans]SDQ16616.1 3D (Asp-Asp-Asp) domain-containing protein [Carnobacterium viridans]
MKKIVLSIIALFMLALGTTGITTVLAAQNEKSENTSKETKTKQSDELEIQNGLDYLIDEREDSKAIVQTLVTSPSSEELLLEPVSIEEDQEKTKNEEKNTVDYTVESGDTLINIATAFEVDVSELIKWNEHVTNDSPLQIDEVIQIETNLTTETIKPEKLTWETETNEEALPVSNQQDTVIEETSAASSDASTEKMTVVATAYSRNQPSLTNITASGIDLSQNPQVIAVDPTVIPLGTKVYVEGYGEAIAGDTGSAIIGNRVDLHMDSIDESFKWGIQEVELTILN